MPSPGAVGQFYDGRKYLPLPSSMEGKTLRILAGEGPLFYYLPQIGELNNISIFENVEMVSGDQNKFNMRVLFNVVTS